MANILVVDDEIGIRELLSEILMDEGHVVLAAENAYVAQEARWRREFDLVLLDIWMPDMDGVTLLKEWKTDELLTMPVIMMSGHATIDMAVDATKIGAFDFLEKPIGLKRLLEAIDRALKHGLPKFEDENASENGLPAETLQTVLPNVYDELEKAMTLPLKDARTIFERMYMSFHIATMGGEPSQIAQFAGLERTHLYRKLKQLGLEMPKKIAKRKNAKANKDGSQGGELD